MRLASLEQSLLDLNTIVEKCQRDIDKSHLKKERLAEENAALLAQIEKMQQACSELGDPIQAHAHIHQLQTENQALRDKAEEQAKQAREVQ